MPFKRPPTEHRIQLCVPATCPCVRQRSRYHRSSVVTHAISWLNASVRDEFSSRLCCSHTPSIAFRHLPPDSARFSYATEGALFISAQLSSDAVSALRKVREKERINTLGLTQNARRKGPSIEKLKVCIKVMLIIIPKEGEHVRIKSIKKVLNRKSRMHTKVFHERIRSLRSSDPRAYWRILNINNRQKKHTVGAISHDLFVEHFENFFMH